MRSPQTNVRFARATTLVALLCGVATAQAQQLRITGVVDGPLTGGVPKAIELYASDAIADLSEYGVGSATNGEGTDGQEFTLSGSAVAGQFVYVATSTEPGFTAFFGFAPDFVNNVANVNGDDAVELFYRGSVIDVFGEITHSGVGPWNTMDGWAYRVDGTGPDGSTFQLGNWRFSGVNALDNETSNATAALPFPIGTFVGVALDHAPFVGSTAPMDGETEVALATDLELTFSEPVSVSEPWVVITCELSGTVPAVISGGPVTFLLEPAFELMSGETCTVDVFASQVVDLDGAPTAMAADQSFAFSTTTDEGCGSGALAIYDVQGDGNTSPLVDEWVVVEAVVTGDFQSGDGDQNDLSGFYLQEETGDGNDATSDGLFVFDGASPAIDVVPGQRVRVGGTVMEFYGETQLDGVTVEVCGSGRVEPTVVSLPSASVVPNFDGVLIANLEAYEGMLVSFPEPFTVSELFNLDRFGEMKLAAGGRFLQYTEQKPPSTAGYADHLANVASRSLMLDDGLRSQNPDPVRYPAPGLSTSNFVRLGDTVSNLTGNVRFSRGNSGAGDETYRLMPTIEPEFVSENPRPAQPPAVGGTLQIASFNVLNLFNTLDVADSACFPSQARSDCRGADSIDEWNRQLQKLVVALSELDADIYALIEIENDTDQGTASTLTTLTDALNVNGTASCGHFDYVDPGVNVGDDAIAVALVYCTESVELAPGTAPAVLTDAEFPELGFAPGEPVFTGFATSRTPLAASFQELASGEVLTVVVNHFKSKGESALDCTQPQLDPNCDQLDGQGYWNARRSLAAQAVELWLDTAPTGSVDADVLLLGDLNAYTEEDPVLVLETAGFRNLLREFGEGVVRYSYVFDGQAGSLDHALASASLLEHVTGVGEWHINADEADALDYNLEFSRPAALFDGTLPFRTADHDPLLIGIALAPPGFCNCYAPEAIVGTDASEVLVGTDGADIICGNGGHDVILGLGGNDCIDAGDGDDTVLAGSGADKLTGGAGDDILLGGAGIDFLDGGEGFDLLSGGTCADQCTTGELQLSCYF